jgi:hypothetical protein
MLIRVLEISSAPLFDRLQNVLSSIFEVVSAKWSQVSYSLERISVPHDYVKLTLFYELLAV